jgi:hypothetical protein
LKSCKKVDESPRENPVGHIAAWKLDASLKEAKELLVVPLTVLGTEGFDASRCRQPDSDLGGGNVGGEAREKSI